MAALAAGVLEPNQLAGISVPEDSEDVAMSEDSKDEAEAEQSDREPDDEESDSDDSESESDSDNEEKKENADGGGDPVKLEPEEAPGKSVSADERKGDKEFCGYCRRSCAVRLFPCCPYRAPCYICTCP